jgi:hypothetical protein
MEEIKGKYLYVFIKKREGAMVFIGMCAKRPETAAYSASMLALVSSSPLTLACDISLPTGWIDLVKRCGCFLLLDSRYSPLAEVMPVFFQSTAPTSHSRIDQSDI